MLRRILFPLLALALPLAPLGCRCFQHKRCDNPAPNRDRDLDPDVIPPKGSTIPPPGLPTGPGGRRDTYSRPLPRLEAPADPFGPRAEVPGAGGELPSELPRPTEQNGWSVYPPEPPPRRAYYPDAPPEPKRDPDRPKKKLVLIPDGLPETLPDAAGERKYTPKAEGGKPLPDAGVFLPPVAAGDPFDLPKRGSDQPADKPEEKREAKSSPKADPPPAGVPGFQAVKGTTAASGRVPTADGVAWLAKAGYRTLVYAHDPKADAAGVRKLAEAGGLTFVDLPVSADTFADAARRFDSGLAEGKAVYVCDDTGVRAGTLWYAHFRGVGLVNADAAVVRAWGLGLADPDTNAEQKPLWDAALGYLAKR